MSGSSRSSVSRRAAAAAAGEGEQDLLARVVPEVAGAFVNLEPLVAATIGAFIFDDPFGSLQLFGAAALVVGLGLSVAPARPLRLLPQRGTP